MIEREHCNSMECSLLKIRTYRPASLWDLEKIVVTVPHYPFLLKEAL